MNRRQDIGLEKLVRYSKVLGTQAHDAMTTAEVRQRWDALFGKPPSLRSVQGDLEYLSATDRKDRPPLVHEVKGTAMERGKSVKQPSRYYLALSQVAGRLITQEAASELSLARQVYDQVLNPTWSPEATEMSDAAGRVLSESKEAQRLSAGIRFLPHGGVGRLRAHFGAAARDEAMKALSQGRQLEFHYKVDHRNPEGRIERLQVSPLGLVGKDGQVYVVGAQGLSDEPKPYALHRMSKVACRHEPAVQRPQFDLDDFIARTHQFSHPEQAGAPPVELALRVHKDAIYHFRERPLTAEQSGTLTESEEGWYLVKAHVPETTQLVPFLVSMGPWVEVLGPPPVRDKVRQWVTDMAARYAGDVVPDSNAAFAAAPESEKRRSTR